jgi:hypothetical protein
MVNTSAALKNSMNYTYGTPTTGLQRMVAVVALGQYPQVLLRSDLKYCQVAAQVAHQAVTTITAPAAKVAITAQEHCKNQWLDLQMVLCTQCVPQARQTVAAAVHVTKIAVTDAPALSMALVSATSVPLVAWVVQLHGT